MTQMLIGKQPPSLQQATLFPSAKIAFAYAAAFILFDWISYNPHPPNWTAPWHPGIGLGLTLLVLFSWKSLLPIVLTYFISEITVRGFDLPRALAGVAIVGFSCAALLLVILHGRLRIDLKLQSLRDLSFLLLVVVAGLAVADAAHFLLQVRVNFVQTDDLPTAFASKWLGDVISVVVIMPAILIWKDCSRLPGLTVETTLQVATFMAALMIALVTFRKGQFGFYPLLFLPVIWGAARSGIAGASLGILLIEFGLFAIVRLEPQYHPDIIQLQTRLVTLAITGLVAGVLVTERQRAELRRYEDALNRLGRLSNTGEFAGMLAHEINQPLTAASTFTRFVAENLESGSSDKNQIIDVAYKALFQVERTAEIMRRLRGLSKSGRAESTPVDMEAILQETLRILAPDIRRHNIVVESKIGHDLPQVMADELQIEQVLFNLVRNAIEAMRNDPAGGGNITIEIERNSDAFVEVRIQDTGSGFPPEFLQNKTPPLFTTKPDGFGIGLSLCRFIIAAHGGQLWFGGNRQGAIAYFSLPNAETKQND